MSLARKVGGFIGGLLFSLSLGFLLFFIALSNFTHYNNLQPMMTNIIQNQICQDDCNQDQKENIYSNLTNQCDTSTTANVSLDNNNSISLKCEDVKNSNPDGVATLIVKSIFDQIYYKKYDCSFISCMKDLIFQTIFQKGAPYTNQNFQIILTQKANDFFARNQTFLIAGMVLGVILIIISMRVWYNILKTIGITLLFVGITYLSIPLIKAFFIGQQTGIDLSAIVDAMFEPVILLLRISLILGIIFTAIGYAASYLLKKPEQKKTQPM